MIVKLYAVKDRFTGFSQLLHEQNEQTAVRNFEDACMRPDSVYHSHPKDFDLYFVGEYNTDDCVITQPAVVPCLVTTAEEIVHG